MNLRTMEELNYWANLEPIDLTEENKKRLESALDDIIIPEIQQFIVFALTRMSTNEKIERGLDAMELGLAYMKDRNLYNRGYASKQTDTFFASLLLHNIWFDPLTDDEFSWLKVFALRDKMEGLAYELLGTSNYQARGTFEFIFQNVEAQLGEKMPTVGNRPVNGQNTYYCWEILWFYYHAVLPAKQSS